MMRWLFCLAMVWAAFTRAAELKVVGVLANTAGMSDAPVPYAYYEGVAVDAQGHVYLAGPLPVIPALNQDGSLAGDPSPTSFGGSIARAPQATRCRAAAAMSVTPQ